MQSLCRDELEKRLTVSNVVDCYQMALLYVDEILKEACMQLITRNLSLVEQTEGFSHLDSDMKLVVFRSVIQQMMSKDTLKW